MASPVAIHATTPQVDVIHALFRVEGEGGFQWKKYSAGQQWAIAEALSRADEKLRVVSYNMLFDRDDQKLEENNRWPTRKGRLIKEIERLDADVIAFQELYLHQVDEVMEQVGDRLGIKFVGQQSQRTENTGEVTGFFYRPDRVDLTGVDAEWFRKAFANPGEFCDPKPRVFCVAEFRDKISGKMFRVFNAHLSFRSPDQRELEVETLIGKARQDTNIPTVLAGDFNTFDNRPDRGDMPFHDGPFLHRTITQAGFSDAREVALLGHVGSMSTSTNDPNNREKEVLFGGTGTPGEFLDHIYVGPGIDVLAHAIDPAFIDGGYPSDHQPVIADILLQARNFGKDWDPSDDESVQRFFPTFSDEVSSDALGSVRIQPAR